MMNSPLFSPDDPRLTAFALGELSDDDRAEIEFALRLDPALRQHVEDLRGFTAQLETVFASEVLAQANLPAPENQSASANLSSPPEQPALRRSWRWHSRRSRPRRIEIVAGREAAPVLEAYPVPRRRARLLQFPQVYFMIAGAAAAGFAVLVAFRDNSIRPTAPATAERLWRREIALGLPDAQVPSVTPASADMSLATTMLPSAADAAPSAPAVAAPLAAAPSAGLVRTNGTPLPAFGFEIETVGYAEIRRWLEQGMLPPPEAVRVEGLLNYLPLPITVPSGETFAASLEVATAPWAPQHKLVRIGIKARDAGPRPPANLVFVVDVSASMRATNKLPLVKEALRRFIARLRPDDRVAVVTDAAKAGVVLPSTPVAQTREILAAIDGITVATDASVRAGIERAYDMMQARLATDLANRVIVFTDGDPTLVSAEAELAHVIEGRRSQGASLNVMGLGHDDRRDSVLQRLAKQGGGTFEAVERGRDVATLLAEQVEGDEAVVARNVSVEVDFNPAAVARYRLIGYESSVATTAGTPPPEMTTSEVVAGDGMLALYEVVPTTGSELSGTTNPVGRGAAVLAGSRNEFPTGSTVASGAFQVPAKNAQPGARSQELVRLTLRYTDPAAGSDVRRTATFPLLDREVAFAAASREFRFSAAVAEFGLILRRSPHRGTATLADVRAWALGAAVVAEDPLGVQTEILEWMRKAQALTE